MIHTKILLFAIGISHSYSGCNLINHHSKQSVCYQNWKKNLNSISALQCCLSTVRDDNNLFDVPIFILPSYTPRDIKCHYSPTIETCSPQIKCVPENLRDLLGFFNFLDLYENIPFEDFASKNKSSKWNCFNSNDDYTGERFSPLNSSSKRIKRLHALEKRVNQNFCRFILLEYVMDGSRSIQKDLCENNYIFPFRRPRKKNRYRIFNPLQQKARICSVNEVNQDFCTRDFKVFMELQYKNPLTIFSDFSTAWRDMGVLDRRDFNWFCGCF